MLSLAIKELAMMASELQSMMDCVLKSLLYSSLLIERRQRSLTHYHCSQAALCLTRTSIIASTCAFETETVLENCHLSTS